MFVLVLVNGPLTSGVHFFQAPETIRARKEIFSSYVSKNGEMCTPETSCLKGTSVHIKNM